MTPRPYLKKSVAELEKLFEENLTDVATLKRLDEELAQRSVPRARALKEKVAPALREQSRNQETHIPASTPVGVSFREQATVDELEHVSTRQTGSSTSTDYRPSQQLLNLEPPTNKPEDVLAGWTAMEVLSPPSFLKAEDLASGERNRVARLSEGLRLPWSNDGERSRPGFRLYYQLVLGTVDMEPSMDALVRVFSDSRAERPRARGEAILATVTLERTGAPIEADSVSVSSFGWGVPIALKGSLDELGRWAQTEQSLAEDLAKRLITLDNDGKPVPLTYEAIRKAFNWLVQRLGLPEVLVKPPAFAIRTYQPFRMPGPPEALLLNSFYLADLEAARSRAIAGDLSGNLHRYLQLAPPIERRNLMTNREAISDALEPLKFPIGSWPAPGRHSLALLQQCAVNLSVHDLSKEGILAVNGPPGTGKTTLLRDIVAAVVTERAISMCDFDDPEDGFVSSGQRLNAGNGFTHLYKLHPRLRGHEIVVASSNNRAVENVSAELPAIQAIANDATRLRHFKTVSDALVGKETWGTISAVLGNAKKRGEFRQAFWWDDDTGLRRYFLHAVGQPQQLVEDTPDGPRKRTPKVIINEDPPRDHDDALRRWRKERQQFRASVKTTRIALAELERAFQLLKLKRTKELSIGELRAELPSMSALVAELRSGCDRAAEMSENQRRSVDELSQQVVSSVAGRSGLLSRLFRTAAYRQWNADHEEKTLRLSEAQKVLARLSQVGAEKASEHQRAAAEHSKLESGISSLAGELKDILSELEMLTARNAGTFISTEFFERQHKEKQLTAAWLDDAAARLRNEVFEAAMRLHKAFVDAAAKPLRHNLSALMDGFGSRSLGTPGRDALIADLWATLFLVVPVVSTTFASVSRMFGKVPTEALGWLLIDEAGQALPQAAIGAIARTRRAVVVGDPMQIEPVVPLPDHMTNAICAHFRFDPTLFSAPAASAQTLADSATGYFGSFETATGTREVGVPLLVHRRCAEPMFSISNSIAYENLMVQAKIPRRSAIRDVLGPSRWLDVEGPGQEKWSPREGSALLEQLEALRHAGCVPDLYVVTPFVVVQDRTRELLRTSRILEGWIDDPSRWLRERVGTVHTVQGREAEAVFFILGAPELGQRGARGWAGARPNLLNVAVTRAKEVVYVIGNRSLWRGTGVFQTLDRYL